MSADLRKQLEQGVQALQLNLSTAQVDQLIARLGAPGAVAAGESPQARALAAALAQQRSAD